MTTTLVTCRSLRPQGALRGEDLVDHLLGREVATQAETAGGAERTADGAPDLARDAHRGPPRVGHEHRLDGVPVGGRRTASCARRRVATRRVSTSSRLTGRSRAASSSRRRRGQRRHVGEVGREAAGQRLVDLSRAVRRLAQRGDGLLDDGSARSRRDSTPQTEGIAWARRTRSRTRPNHDPARGHVHHTDRRHRRRDRRRAAARHRPGRHAQERRGRGRRGRRGGRRRRLVPRLSSPSDTLAKLGRPEHVPSPHAGPAPAVPAAPRS